MKLLKLILKIITALYALNSLKAQTFVVSQLPALLKLAQNDSIQKTERCAAFKFHRIINSYRKEKGLDTLAWDEALWLTCKNHNAWMGTNKVLNHNQISGTTNFTGAWPEDRYKYTTNGEGNCQWNGENALYNFEHNGKTVNEVANNIAESSFQQWKHSPGHNSNMLNRSSKVHGVAFNLNNNGIVYGTDLFAINLDGQFNNLSTKNQMIVYESIVPKQNIPPPAKRVKLDLNKIKTDLLGKLYETEPSENNLMVRRSKAMEKASAKHSEYMCSVKKLTHDELKSKSKFYGANEEQRMIKASHGFYFLKKKRNKLTESIVIIEADGATLDLNKLAKEIQSQLDNEHLMNATKSNVGYGLSIKCTRNNLKFYVTRIIGSKNT